MVKKILAILTATFVLAAGSAFAQMGGGHMGGGTGSDQMGGGMGDSHMGSGYVGGGPGYGMHGAGGIVSGMMGNMVSHGYLDILDPITTPAEATAVIRAFLDASNTGIEISELWEYETAYKAELSDTAGEKAFDLLADKFTGTVAPEMGLSMMMNSSYGDSLYRMTTRRGNNLTLTAAQAKVAAESFIAKNSLGYSLVPDAPETYPGFYKFHSTKGTWYGMDILVNGYNGNIWMNTLLGIPLAQIDVPPAQ